MDDNKYQNIAGFGRKNTAGEDGTNQSQQGQPVPSNGTVQPVSGQFFGGESIQGQGAQSRPTDVTQNLNAQMPNGQIGNRPIPNGQMPNGQMGNRPIPNGQMLNGQMGNRPIPNAQMPNAQMGNRPIPNGQMPNSQMGNRAIPNGQIPNGQMGNRPIPNGQIPNGQMGNRPIPNGQMPNGQMGNRPIPNAQMPNGQMGNRPIPNGQMPNAHMGNGMQQNGQLNQPWSGNPMPGNSGFQNQIPGGQASNVQPPFGQRTVSGGMQNPYGQPPMGGNQYGVPYGYPTTQPPKKKKSFAPILGMVALLLVVLGIGAFVSTSGMLNRNKPSNRHSQYNLDDNGVVIIDDANVEKDELTIIYYIIASNLESGEQKTDGSYEGNGCATDDLDMLLEAKTAEGINVVLQTGGTNYWTNEYGMEDGHTQRFELGEDEFILKEDLGTVCMTDEDSLLDYLVWVRTNYPAKRYMLVMWDHGIAGADISFGVDETSKHGDCLETYEIADAIKTSGIKLDLTVFNACLCGTVEMASQLNGISDYIMASEEVIYSFGFQYTDWLNMLYQDPHCDTVECAKFLIDQFADSYDMVNYWYGDGYSYEMALIDTKKAEEVRECLDVVVKKADEELYAGEFNTFITARNKCFLFSEGSSAEVDIVDFCNQYYVDGSDELVQAVEDSIIYIKSNMNYAHGLSFYCPGNAEADIYYYSYIGRIDIAQTSGYESLQLFIDDYISIQGLYYEDAIAQELGITQYTNDKLCEIYADEVDIYVAREYDMDYEYINGGYYLNFGSEIDTVSTVEKRVGYEYTEGQAIALGSDFRTNIYADGYIDISFPEKWISVDGQVVCYATTKQGYDEQGEFNATSVIPFIFPDTYEQVPNIYGLVLNWYTSKGDLYYSLAGYSKIDVDTMQLDSYKYALEPGEKIQFVYALISHDGNQIHENSVEFTLLVDMVHTVPESGLSLSYDSIEKFEEMLAEHYTNTFEGYTYARIKDIYGNVYVSDLVPSN